MGALTVRLLGGIYLEKDEGRLDDKLSLKALALLSLLLTTEEQRLRKSRIMTLLWPDSDEDASRNNLRYNLWNLKKLIPEEDGQELVLADKNTVFLNPRYPLTADILTLRAFDSASDYDDEQLEGFSRLFRGEYLEGFYVKGCMEFSDLILMERIQCQNLQIEVLKKRYDSLKTAGQHRRCSDVLRELMQIDPYNEQFACQMMHHLLEAGQYAGTLTFYKQFTSNLRKDLNLAPPQKLRRLYEQVVQGRYGQIGEDGTVSRTPGGIANGSGGEAADHDQEPAVQVRALCLAGIEYFFIVECIKQLTAALPEAVRAEVAPELRQELAFLWPGIVGEVAGYAMPGFVPQVRLLDAFYGFLSALAKGRPLDILIDDRMELDAPSRNFILLLEHRPIEGVSVVSLK